MDKTSENDRIDELVEAIMKVSRGDYSTQVEISTEGDQIDSLALGLNMMIDDIKAAFEKDKERLEELGNAYQELQVTQEASLNIMEDLDGQRNELNAINKQLQQEITQRRRAEERIRLFSDAVDGAYDSIILTDLNGNVTYANESTLKAFGYTQQEIMGLHVTSFTPDPKDAEKIFVEVVQKGKWGGETIAVKKGKEKFPVTTSISLIKDANGELIGTMAVFRDITAQKKAEEELRESEERYRNLFETATDGIFTMDSQTRFTSSNRKAEEMCGYSRDELIGEYATVILPEEEIPRMADALKKVLRGETDTYETRIITKKGDLLPVEVTSSSMEIDGKIIGTMGMARDITERKRAEEELKASEERYRSYIEVTGQLGWITNPIGEVEEDIPAWRAYTGQSFREVKGRGWTKAIHPDDVKRTTWIWGKAVKTRSTYETEYRVRSKDGKYQWFLARGVPVLKKDRSIQEWVGTCIDISERKKAEEKLRESEKKYRTILENMADGYYEVDLAGNFTFFNNSMCEIIAYSPDEMMGMNNRKYMDKENARKVYQTFNKVYTTGKPAREFDWEIIRKDGTKRFVEASVSLIRDAEGKPARFRGIVRDTTARKQMEKERAELEQRAQLTSRLSIVGKMASGIVHEINNPLTSVIGFAQLLAQQDLPEDAREYATIINNEGQRVANIAGRILDFARHQKPERVYADINQLIESTLELQAYEMEAGNIKVTTQLDPHLPRTTADVGQLQQVFLNIILNARTEMQSAHGKGKFLVKTEAIDNTIRISFEDTGPGIAKENLEKIFEPFFTTKEVGTATGLGLSICHEIIANHNGQIYARSTLGKGATFIIELPVVARQRETATTARANANTVWR